MSPHLAGLLIQFLELVSWLIIIQVVLSWVIRDPDQPLMRLLRRLTDPILRPLSSVLTFGGLDLAPLVVLLIIHGLQRVLAAAAGG